jgi:hypothetical protein
VTAAGVNAQEQTEERVAPDRTTAANEAGEPRVMPGWRRFMPSGRMADLLVGLTYLLGALFVYAHWWAYLDRRYMTNSLEDQSMYEWFFMYVARSVMHLQNPLYTHLQNAPIGVNMMANTPMLGVSIPLTPITLLFGPTVAYAIVLIGSMAVTGWAWYWLFSRHVVKSRIAAWVAGGFCAFAAPIISHGNGHANWIAHFLIPVIAWRTIKLREPGRAVRNGLILGGLLVYQVFLGEEVLFVSAIAIASFVLIYALQRRDEAHQAWRPFVAGLAVAAVTAGIPLAYPLWLQMFGPMHYNGLPGVRHINNDLRSFFSYGTETIAGNAQLNTKLAFNTTEENSFFGWTVLLLIAGLAGWLWRSVLARTAVFTAVGFCVMSLGFNIAWNGKKTGIPGPWRAIDQLPLFDSILPSRLSLVAVPCLGVLLALGIDRIVTERRPRRRWLRYGLAAAVVVALLPTAPTPLPVRDRPPVPKFFSDGTWRKYVGKDRSLVAVPLPDPLSARPLNWQVAANGDFILAEGYFVGPHGPEKTGGHGADHRPTAQMFYEVQYEDRHPLITPAVRAQAIADLRYWKADVIVLQPERPRAAATVEELFGPGAFVDGVWIWDVRHLTR